MRPLAAASGVVPGAASSSVAGRAAQFLFAVSLLLPSIVIPARAAWQSGGIPLGGLGSGTRIARPASNAWTVAEGATSCLVVRWGWFGDPGVLRVTAGGDTTRLWPSPGMFPATPGMNYRLLDAASDQAGGVIVLWQDYAGGWQRLRAQRLVAPGVRAPGWPDSGAVVSDSLNTDFVRMVADGAGGAFAAWNEILADSGLTYLRVQHVSATGGVAVPGGARAFLAPGSRRAGCIIPDGGLGAFVVVADDRALVSGTTGTDVYAQRVDAALTRLWGDGGVAVCANPGSQSYPVAMLDGGGGAYVAWSDEAGAPAPPAVLSATRLDAAGKPATGWPAGGVPVRPGTAFQDLHLASDGAGGALLSSINVPLSYSGVLRVDRLHAAGLVDTLWHPSIHQALGAYTGSDNLPSALVADGTGGAFLCWDGGNVLALRIGADGQAAPGWDPAGVVLDVPIPGGATYAVGVSAVPTMPGQAFVVFQLSWYYDMAHGCGYHEVCYNRYLYGQYLLASGVVPPGAVGVGEPPLASFALAGPRPNPAAGSLQVTFALPDAAPARLEVLDLAGRRVRAREVGALGAGNHVVDLSRGGALPPGVYLVRLTRGERSLVARAVVVR